MKKLVFCAFLCSLIYSSLHAQTSPRVISYQGLLRPAGSMTGSQIAGNRLLTVTLYGDANGTVKLWQSTINTLIDSSGVFNCLLGTPDNPLPNSAAMDRPMWIGIAVDHNSEMRPFAQFTASPYALNVADSSITSSKLNMNYVSSISVNGQPITGVGTNLNLVAGDGLNLTWVPTASTLTLSGTGGAGDGKTMSVDWELGGNSISSPPMQFLGTIDSAALEIHVNSSGDTLDGNGRVMLYQPMQSSANIVGGFRTNYVTSTDSGGDVIAGGGNYTHPNWIAGNFGTVSGGYGNTAYSGGVVGGGTSNFANITATVAGGTSNAAALGGTVGGGIANITSEEYTTISGGWSNTINLGAIGPPYPEGLYSSIGGGDDNNIYGPGSTIPGGGQLNLGSFSFGYNGDSLQVGGSPRVTDLSLVQGIGYFGNVNVMIGNVDSVARQLRFYGPNTSLTYGSSAKYTAFCAPLMDSDVLYTLPNAQGANSTVLTEDGHGNLSWGPGIAADTNNWSITGNHGTSPPTNFLGTLDSQAFEIHVHNNTLDTTGGNQRVMRYSEGVTSPNLLGGSSFNTLGTGLSGAAVLSGGSAANPNRDSAVFSVVAGGEGNAIDALSEYCDIGGGRYNTISSSYESTILGGYGNLMVSANGVIGSGFGNTIYNGISNGILGGDSNYLYGSYSAMLGGYDNRISNANYATIGGGTKNRTQSDYTGMGGGENNTIGMLSDHASIAGGGSNTIISSAYAAISGGYNNIDSNAAYSAIVSGNNNHNQGQSSVIASGSANTIVLDSLGRSSVNSFVGAGQGNTIGGSAVQPNAANDAAIVAGSFNYVTDSESFIGAGNSNTITEQDDFILAGYQNRVLAGSVAGSSGIGAGNQNTLDAAQSMIGAGLGNTIDTGSTSVFIGAGSGNYVSAAAGFAVAGVDNRIYGSYSGVGAGTLNIIDSVSQNSFVGAGTSNVAIGQNTFIGSGTSNTTDTIAGAGSYAAIPAGQELITQSYAQTALGFYNIPAGSTVNDTNARLANHIDDPLVVVGNGERPLFGVPRPSDAFTVANAGYSTAYDNIASGGGTGVSGPNTKMGSTYADNTIEVWGNVHAASKFTTDDIGVDHMDTLGGVYTIYLNVRNPDNTLHTFTTGKASITASIEPDVSGGAGLLTVSELSTAAPGTTTKPIFVVKTYNLSGALTNTFGFQFHVVAR